MVDLNLMAENIRNLLSATPGIVEAFDHEPQSMRNLPAATLFFDGFGQSEQTTRRSNVNWQWAIRLYIPLRTSDIKAPQVELRNLIQSTIKKFRTDISLGGTCFWHSITAGEVFALLEQANPMLVVELTLSATTEE